ncbi:retron Ec67 family RNA-directed DNA polymerase/endonuclease [Salinicoccus roseus]|uniref:retron Ec67 family RNA-directed DNA polymerase/endonuclease n=1 Tax=Salinicoccus roseus TaxID=45670 RepID=UPI001CA67A84|nr:retron Ec67 family RNA-directed DNA polymerase/endonuclease [Salinicoccus roseus]MBY8908256.1 retron Ec67 family RNA-directed DNA polymerase/endonuclease [Salinicoccus roseus]
MNKLSEIKTRSDLAATLSVSEGDLVKILYYEKDLYQNFDIAKKNGTSRKINAPKENLKKILQTLNILLNKHVHDYYDENNSSLNVSHGFEKGRDIVSNAEVHINKKFVFNTDIKDFFPSIHFGRVRGLFHKHTIFQMDEYAATMLAQLTCYNGSLPQGAPTSPLISNLICRELDIRMLRICKKFRLHYTRYADDLTFSTNNKNFQLNYENFYKKLNNEINSAGFSLKHNKSRLQQKTERQEVTGLTVNNKVNVNRKFYLKTRAMAHSFYENGSFYINNNIGTMRQLEGRLAFINRLDKENNIRKYERLTNEKDKMGFFKHKPLNAREKEYQKFLFYKNFWVRTKPLIITEGKTDPLYIKAALKKYYKEYPELIELNNNNDFEFKIDFFNRTSKLRYFFELEKDGADTMNRLINYYVHKNYNSKRNDKFNYYHFFHSKMGVPPLYPIVFLFDNEYEKKPLHKFIDNVAPLTNKPVKTLKKELNKTNPTPQNLIGNTYILSVPKSTPNVNGEIEDLLLNITKDLTIKGKKYNKNGGDQYIGKDILSKYIYQEYESLNLDSLKPLLDRIVNLKIMYEK